MIVLKDFNVNIHPRWSLKEAQDFLIIRTCVGRLFKTARLLNRNNCFVKKS